MILDSNTHSVFKLTYHLVLPIKYRKPIISLEISKRLNEIFEDVSKKYKTSIIEFNHDIDHIHILFSSPPNISLSKFVNTYKSMSSRIIKNEFKIIKKSLWKECFWSRGYCILTTGGATIETIKKYIQNQGI